MSDLDYITTNELVAELCSRSKHCFVMQVLPVMQGEQTMPKLWTYPNEYTALGLIQMGTHMIEASIIRGATVTDFPTDDNTNDEPPSEPV